MERKNNNCVLWITLGVVIIIALSVVYKDCLVSYLVKYSELLEIQLKIIGGLFVVIALLYNYKRTKVLEDNLLVSKRGQDIDRLNYAIEHFTSVNKGLKRVGLIELHTIAKQNLTEEIIELLISKLKEISNSCNKLVDSIYEDEKYAELEYQEYIKNDPNREEIEEQSSQQQDIDEEVTITGKALDLKYLREDFYAIVNVLFANENEKIAKCPIIDISSLNMQEGIYKKLNFSNAKMDETNIENCKFGNVNFPITSYKVRKKGAEFVKCSGEANFEDLEIFYPLRPPIS